MRLSEVFDDLGEFVRHYRGRISREGLLLFTNTSYEAGTVLDIEIRLTDGLTLVIGQAGVVHVRSGSPANDRTWTVVLQWVDIDEDSAALLDRLAAREQADGVPPFRLDSVLPPPVGQIRGHGIWPQKSAGSEAEETGEETDDELDVPAPFPADFESAEALGELVSTALGASTLAATQRSRDRQPSSGRRPATRKHGNLGHVLRWIVGLGAVAVIVATMALLWLPSAGGRRGSAAVDAGSPAAPTAQASPIPSATHAIEVESETSPVAARATAPAPRTPAAIVTVAATGPAPDAAPAATVARAADPTATPLPPAPRIAVAGAGAASPAALAIAITSDDDATVVTITADVAVHPGRVLHGRLDSPPGPREVVRILGVASCSIEPRIDIAGSHLAAVRTWLHDELDPAELHVVLDLADPTVHADPPQLVGNTVRIRLTR